MKKAFLCGILASFFFAFTFLLNSSMNLSGGYWMWSACLRYFITLPLMVPLVWKTVSENGIRQVLNEIKKNPVPWFLWSTVGFGFFYLPLTMASIYGASWMVAASWQITIVAGILLTPLFGKRNSVEKSVYGICDSGRYFSCCRFQIFHQEREKKQESHCF